MLDIKLTSYYNQSHDWRSAISFAQQRLYNQRRGKSLRRFGQSLVARGARSANVKNANVKARESPATASGAQGESQQTEINRTCRFFKNLVILLLLLQAVAATVMVATWLAQSRL